MRVVAVIKQPEFMETVLGHLNPCGVALLPPPPACPLPVPVRDSVFKPKDPFAYFNLDAGEACLRASDPMPN